ncbi:beta-propeller fold lactonase family protein [Actinosynnema sp. CS-041913]|uniref:beta-propeller fold lactonase family protein n=1 Tax=Actinosynnema sp. CS-041913 TaxID=3239917 RepID=UPI003D8B0ED0
MARYLLKRTARCVVAGAAVVGLAVAGVAVVAPPAVAGELGFAYVANSQSDTVTTISVSTGGTATIRVGGGPSAVAISPDGSLAYVANTTSDSVSAIRTATKSVVATFASGGSRPAGVAFNALGTRAFVTNAGSDTVSTIDTATHGVVALTAVGKSPTGITVTPDGTRAYVSNTNSNTVSVLDTTTTAHVDDIAVGTRPGRLAATPDSSKVLVVNTGSGDVSVLDTGSNRRIQTVAVGAGPSGVAVAPDGLRAYVSNGADDTVTVLDTDPATTDSIAVRYVVRVGHRPTGVAISPDGDKVYVSNSESGTTSVIDTATTRVSTADVDSGPTGIATGVPQTLTAAVSLGDSFISGVAGRWQGNGVREELRGSDVLGTDRAVYRCGPLGTDSCKNDPKIVYGRSYDNKCLRSYSAQIQAADLPVTRRINLACSGADTSNIINTPLKNEPPQSRQLALVARDYQVKLVVLNVGGNDIGFRDIIKSCVITYLRSGPRCRGEKATAFTNGLVRAETNVALAIDKVREVMAAAGHHRDDYRFVLQSYPSPVPTGAQIRYPEANGYDRYQVGGCPVYNSDADWVRNVVVPKIADSLEYVADQKEVEFLDVRDLFSGHEVCARSAEQATDYDNHLKPQLGDKAEWARFLDATPFVNQGDTDESVHPNYYGQQALGSCLTAFYEYSGDKWNHLCRNVPGKGAKHVVLDQID